MIKLNNKNTIRVKQYPILYIYRSQEEQELKQREKWDVISRMQIEYSLPIVIVKKKWGGIRVYLDARELNKQMEKDVGCTLPLNELLYQPNRKASPFTSFDLTDSHWQEKLEEKSI